MTEEEAVQTIWAGLSGDDSIPSRLRAGRGLDRARLAEVKAAMAFLAERWQGRDSVPKRVAAAFVDLQGSMQWGRDRYSEEQQDEIEDAAVELVNLAYGMLEDE